MAKESFKDKTAIVTGASSGIGRSIALGLAEEGAGLVLAARSAERLESLAAECRARGGKVLVAPTDVAVEEQCRALVQKTEEAFGRIDLLVNNAGTSQLGKLASLAGLDIFRQVMRVNFDGTLNCTFHALPALKKTRGRIVNVCSLAGLIPLPHNSSYIASKFAVTGFSDSLRMELRPEGVSVTVVYPYWVVTEFHEHLVDKDGKPKGPAGREFYTKRMMTADQCAEIVIRAARRRKRQVLMGPGGIGVLLRAIAPGLLDAIIMKAVLLPAAKRMGIDP